MEGSDISSRQITQGFLGAVLLVPEGRGTLVPMAGMLCGGGMVSYMRQSPNSLQFSQVT